MKLFNRPEWLCLTFLLTIQIWIWRVHAQAESTSQPEVIISQGTLHGTTMTTNHGRNISAFLGIPYGQPPVGNLRFANPVAADGWTGILNATVDSDVCFQNSNNLLIGDEDCLYLNVYTPLPEDQMNSSQLPVMVYIYGGAFQRGNGKSTNNDPRYILDADVLLVVPNYRVGPLGFLSTGDEVASGNWGLKDQVLALRWVQDNIEYFGGDPDQVTIFGCSAGSASVHLLTLSNAATGLFHRYITQSGSALSTWAHQPRAQYANYALQLGEYVGCSNETSDSLISCLRTLNASDITSTFSQFQVWNNIPGLLWGPTDEPDIEGAILTDSPANLFTSGKVSDLPWLAGVVREEGLLHSVAVYEDEEIFEDFLQKIDYVLPHMLTLIYQPDSGVAWVDAMKSFYLNGDLTTDRSTIFTNLTTLISDALFIYPAYNAFRQQLSLTKSPQYLYAFHYRGTYSNSYSYSKSLTNYGVAHGDDTLYLFPPDLKLANFGLVVSETDLEMVDAMVQLWTSFAINGTPTTSALNGGTWEPFSEEENYLLIGSDADVTLQSETYFYKERMQFWVTLDVTEADSAAVADGSGAVVCNAKLTLAILLPAFVLVLSEESTGLRG